MSVLQRKAQVGKQEHQARAMTVPKALRVGLAKVADDAFDMALAVIGVTKETAAASVVLEDVGEETLLLLLDGVAGKVGGALLGSALVSALVQQQTTGRRLYAPLFIDLKSKRSHKDRTWRRLTVAEGLEIQAVDMAAGYRVQIGSRQWLFYRSLGPKGNRTLLGQNYACDFYAGRITRDGLTDEIIEVE